ncbi:MAG: response regulator transcription factor [Nitrospiraceae bacterium]|nr:response regulator transcription factor [Nitrospiraceae bacterium]
MVNSVLVAEDDRKIARVVKVYLEQAGYIVTVAEKGHEAIDEAAKGRPAVVILDLMLPDMNGEEVFREIKKLGDIPVIMLTAKSAPEERIAGFALGADDYIVKPFNPREMVYRVKAVLKRASAPEGLETASMSFNKGSLCIDGLKHEVRKRGVPVNFTPSEFRILIAFASAPQWVLTREKLIEKAFGYQFEGFDRTIDVHIKNMRQKIEDDPRNPAFIVTVHRVGYKFVGERDI